MCRSDTSETKTQQKRAFHCATMAHILSYGFSMPCKRQALLFPTLSPPLSPLLQIVLTLVLVSYVEYCFVPFTAAPLICGLAFTYQVSAVCFAWLCGGGVAILSVII